MYESQSAVSSWHLFHLDPKASVSQSQEEHSPGTRFPKNPSEDTFPLPRLTKSIEYRNSHRKYGMLPIGSMQDTFGAPDYGDTHPLRIPAQYG